MNSKNFFTHRSKCNGRISTMLSTIASTPSSINFEEHIKTQRYDNKEHKLLATVELHNQ